MSLCEEEKVSQEILRYLLRHPDAQDTFEGIFEWWLFEERLVRKYSEVQGALTRLVSDGFVLEKRVQDSNMLYCLDKSKKNLIEKIVEDESKFE